MVKSRKQQIFVDWEKRTVDYSEETGKYFFAECFAGTENAPISLFNVNEIQNPDDPKIPEEEKHNELSKKTCILLVLGFVFVTTMVILCNLA